MLVTEDAQAGGANYNGRFNGGAFYARPTHAAASAFSDMVAMQRTAFAGSSHQRIFNLGIVRASSAAPSSSTAAAAASSAAAGAVSVPSAGRRRRGRPSRGEGGGGGGGRQHRQWRSAAVGLRTALLDPESLQHRSNCGRLSCCGSAPQLRQHDAGSDDCI